MYEQYAYIHEQRTVYTIHAYVNNTYAYMCMNNVQWCMQYYTYYIVYLTTMILLLKKTKDYSRLRAKM